MRIILACACGGSKKNAETGFSVLFPNDELPEMVFGKENIAKFAADHPNDHIKAIAKLTGKFAYYVELDNSNNITKEYDLYTGKRIA